MADILVVDDSAADRELAGHLLEAQDGWSVAYAADGKQALAYLEAHAPDLVVTDLQMPDLDGLGLVEQVKEHYPLLPVIVITAKGSEETAAKALETGAASYVVKKALVRDLVDTVERLLAASRERQSYTRLLTRLEVASFVLERSRADLVGRELPHGDPAQLGHVRRIGVPSHHDIAGRGAHKRVLPWQPGGAV